VSENELAKCSFSCTKHYQVITRIDRQVYEAKTKKVTAPVPPMASVVT